MALVKSSFIIVTLMLAACSEFPDVKPTVLDIQLNEGRVYNIIDKKNFTIQYSHSITIPEMNGYFCLSQADFAAVKQYAIDNQNACQK
jgi:hypothetical protein